MSESSRPTALGVARARFVEGLGRKGLELRGALALIVAAPADSRLRLELRRRLHALWASAQVFEIDALSEALREATGRIDAAESSRQALSQDDLDALAALCATLGLLGAAPVATPPDKPLSSPSMRASRPRRSVATPRPAPLPPLPTVYSVGVSLHRAAAVRSALAGTGVEVTGGEPAALADEIAPDLLIVDDPDDAVRSRLAPLGGVTVEFGSFGTTDGHLVARAIIEKLRGLTPPTVEQAEARLALFERRVRAGMAARTRLDGMRLAHILRFVESGLVRVRDAHDSFDVEIRGAEILDVIRTRADGSFIRGPRAVVSLLGTRRGLLEWQPNDGPARTTILDGARAMEQAETFHRSVQHIATSDALRHIAKLALDDEAVQAAHKEGAVDRRVLDALIRTRSPRELLDAGASAAGVGAALIALGRAGAIDAITGDDGTDLLDVARQWVRAQPGAALDEPAVRALTIAPPPALEIEEISAEEAEELEAIVAASERPPAPEDPSAEPTAGESSPPAGDDLDAADDDARTSTPDLGGSVESSPPEAERSVDDTATEPLPPGTTPARSDATPTVTERDRPTLEVGPRRNTLAHVAILLGCFALGYFLWRGLERDRGVTPPRPAPTRTEPSRAEARPQSATNPPVPIPVAPSEPIAPERPPVVGATPRWTGLGHTEPNTSAPQPNTGWVRVAASVPDSIVVGTIEARAGQLVAVPVGAVPVMRIVDGTVRVRFVAVTPETTRVVEAF